jgi:hypothetical protein
MSDKVFVDEHTLSLLAPVEIIPTKLEISESEKIEVVDEEELSPAPSFTFMIQDELRRAFQDTEEEIEKEFALSRYNMIQSIHARPRFKYY